MGDELIKSITSIAVAIVGLAVLAVIVSKNANTTAVIQASASGFNNALATAAAPVSGTQLNVSLAYPSSNSFATIGE